MNKRSFLKRFAFLGFTTGSFLKNIDKWVLDVSHMNPEEIAKDEDFWYRIRSGYRLKPDYINLENGYYCIMPQETLENYFHHTRSMNYQGSFYMRNNQWENKHAMHQKVAELVGCTADEIVLTRNTTESLDTIIGGFPWNKGDEALMAEQDYGAMLNMFDQVSERYSIKASRISIPLHPKSDDEIVELYKNAITTKTRLLMICHMINITGHILPVRKICDMAHAKGVEVMVDGAHAYAHIDFNMKDLECDYYGASLHKWLSAPLGSGMLYVRKEKIPKIWPLMADWDKPDDSIERLNHTGTHPCHTDLAVSNALEYHYRIGPKRKEARLRYLQRYWTDQVREWDHIVLNTPADPKRACAIANVGIKGMEPGDLAKTLLEKYRIWTVAINSAGVRGCRITPNIYTTTRELDQFVQALKELA